MSDTATLTLVDDPVWTDRYHKVRRLLQTTASDGLRDTFHVGSTAIPDVDGKPELDVIAVYEEYSAMDEAATAIESVGFERLHDEGECIVSVRQLDGQAEIIKFHLPGDERVRSQLLGRYYLSAHETARRRYEQIKHDALSDHPDSREDYTKSKTEFVGEIIDLAIEAGYDERLPDTI